MLGGLEPSIIVDAAGLIEVSAVHLGFLCRMRDRRALILSGGRGVFSAGDLLLAVVCGV